MDIHNGSILRQLKVAGSKIPKTANAASVQPLRSHLCHSCRKRKHGDIHTQLVQHFFHLIDGINTQCSDARAAILLLYIKRCNHRKIALFNGFVARKCLAHIAHADNGHRLHLVHPQQRCYVLAHFCYGIAAALPSSAAKGIDILTHLRGGDARKLRQFA